MIRSSSRGTAAALLAAALFAAPAAAAPTDLDASFGTSGVTTTSISNPPGTELASLINDVVAQPDGKLLFAGGRFRSTNNHWEWVIGRYSADGVLDSGFNGGAGYESLPNGPQNLSFADAGGGQPIGGATAVVAEPGTGLIDVGGQTTGASAPVSVLQLDSSGAPSGTYGGASGVSSIPITNSSATTVHAMALQPDGKLVVAGEAYIGGHYTPFAARFQTNGTPDSTFATNGLLLVSPCDDAIYVAQDCNEGGLALATSGGSVTAIYLGGFALQASLTGRIWRLLPTGGGGTFQLDTGFGGSGAAIFDRSVMSEVDSLMLVGGNAVVAGYANNGSNSKSCAIARASASTGAVDPAFGAHIDIGGTCTARDVAVDSSGRFVFTGESYSGTQSTGTLSLAAGRWTGAGQPDTAFAAGGGAALSPGGSPAFGEAILLQGDKPVVAGGAGSGAHDLMIARLAGGTLPADGGGTGGGGGGGGGGNTPAFAPFNIHVPGIIGATPPFKLGAQLSCDPGTWGPSGGYTITAYRWYRYPFTTSASTFNGAPARVSSTQGYTVGKDDQGQMLACAAIATNAKGSNVASSPRAAVRQRVKIPARIRRMPLEKAKALLRTLFDGQVSFGADGAGVKAIPCDFGGDQPDKDGCTATRPIEPGQVFNSTPPIGHFIDEAYGSGKLPKIVLDYYDPAKDKTDDVPKATPKVECPATMGSDIKNDFENRLLGHYVQYARDLLTKYNCPFSETTKYTFDQSVDPYVTEVQGASFGGDHGYRITVTAPKHYELVAVVFHRPRTKLDGSNGANFTRGPRPPGIGDDGKITALKGSQKNDLCFHVIEVSTGRGVPGAGIRAYAPNGSDLVDTNGRADTITTDSAGNGCGSFSIRETGVYRFGMTYAAPNRDGTTSVEYGELPLTAINRGTKQWTTLSGRPMKCEVDVCNQLAFGSSRRAHAANVLDDIGNFFRGILDKLSGRSSPIVNKANAKEAATADGGTVGTLFAGQRDNGVTPGILAGKGGVKIISQDGGSIISQDGGSIISQDGGSIISDHGVGLRVKINSIISQDGGSVVALSQGSGARPAIGGGTTVVAVRDGRIISQDGGSLLGDAGAGIISDNGGGIIGDAGASVLSDNGLGLVAPRGGQVVMYGNKSVIADANGVIPKGTLISDSAAFALPLSGFISDNGSG